MTTAVSSTPGLDRSAAARRPRRSAASWAMAAIKPLASLKLTVALFALSLVLIFVATLAQVDRGIWHVLEVYFKAPVAWVPLSVFVPGQASAGGVGGLAIPMPGGVVVGGALLVNLLAAHAVRFKMKARGGRLVLGVATLAAAVAIIYAFHYVATWHDLLVSNGLPVLFVLGSLVYAPLIAATWLLFGKRLGIVLVHASIVLLLVGEGLSAYTRDEAQLVLREGQTAAYAHDIRETELAITRPLEEIDGRTGLASATGPRSPVPGHGYERVVAIPQAMLAHAARDEAPLAHPELPFTVDVELWYPNATMFSLPPDGSIRPMATAGEGLRFGLRPLPRASGVGDQRVDLPGAVLRFDRDGQTIERLVVYAGMQRPEYAFVRQPIEVAGETYEVALRFRRVPLPAAFTLDAFHHDLYPGTDVPSNFSSDLRLVDASAGEDRAVSVYMNHPLRHAGLTYFQAGYLPENAGTILQVVSNPAAELPYIACVAGGLGLAIHFALSLAKYSGKRRPRKGVVRG